jgi:hypothetical protein
MRRVAMVVLIWLSIGMAVPLGRLKMRHGVTGEAKATTSSEEILTTTEVTTRLSAINARLKQESGRIDSLLMLLHGKSEEVEKAPSLVSVVP